MKVTKLMNTSKDDVTLDLANGDKITLTPGSVCRDMEVTNINEIRENIEYTRNLTEVNE